MEDPGSENHDWDWEVVVQDSSQLPKSEEEEEAEEEDYSPSSYSSTASSSRGGVIRSDYFSLDYAATAAATDAAAEKEVAEVDSDNPSWVDPSGSSVVGCGRRGRSRSPNSSSESSSDSVTADHSSGGTRNLLFLIQPHTDCGVEFQTQGFSSFEHLGIADDTIANTSEMIPNNGGNGSGNIWADSGGSVSGEFHAALDSDKGVFHPKEKEAEQQEEDEHGSDQVSHSHSGDANENMVVEEGRESELGSNEKQRVVWWKVPLEVLRYCVLKVSPVWSLSVAAAAIMGFVLLRRRWLYKMKRKNQGLQLKVTVDDKKVSQFMSHAARLNEAFSVVKRVPIIRPALPAPGMAPWPMVSFR